MHGRRLGKRILVALALAAATLALCGAAVAASPRQQQYANPAATETAPAKQTETTPSSVSQPSSSGQGLPFTGLQLGAASAIGLALVALGLGVRRLGRNREG